MVLERPGTPLVKRDLPVPDPGPGQIRLRVLACGVCRTDLHVCDGELSNPKLPLVPGHEIVGVVDRCGAGVGKLSVGQRVGVPWLGHTCGECPWCLSARENLCDHARFTGYQIDGGYAEFTVAEARYCFPLPENFDDVHAAPLLCAGLIGFRAYRLAGSARTLGLYGFGAAAHILAQFATAQGRRVFAFTRAGDSEGQSFARQLGAVWAGDSGTAPPEALEAAIIFAPVGALVPIALRDVVKGGTVVCAGIHMSDIPSFPYRLLWEERDLRSVANLTRRDGEEFFAALRNINLHTTVKTYPLGEANTALSDLRHGRLNGAAVLIP
ncbi:MAG TPA: zinc-dependent alcohol dehydrogenase family protein [Opitutaceae bacterium]|nr:zinc-dependent alcohol dehydrogenase family protein [Opitutaceae bacterium]